MRVRTRDRGWEFTRQHAFHVLGLDGTGALHPIRLRGVVRIERGGVWVSVDRATPERRTERRTA